MILEVARQLSEMRPPSQAVPASLLPGLASPRANLQPQRQSSLPAEYLELLQEKISSSGHALMTEMAAEDADGMVRLAVQEGAVDDALQWARYAVSLRPSDARLLRLQHVLQLQNAQSDNPRLQDTWAQAEFEVKEYILQHMR